MRQHFDPAFLTSLSSPEVRIVEPRSPWEAARFILLSTDELGIIYRSARAEISSMNSVALRLYNAWKESQL